ncbi:MAG: hypothetical protein EZS26_003277 [Candidatus Ordinivivax streblomastigis]|uniref:Uncharacterized protein n=1 Tax=Candidatus Ordinivivax streblomastigis TaxID=2540710 RepID=A0A5M8NV94_9BACT|nr:MAG: hypothetical protein EZS26_003277 [Candidatus Ordinivivax streblomastigis]
MEINSDLCDYTYNENSTLNSISKCENEDLYN